VARYEFRFVVSDVRLTKAQEAQIGAAVAQAGALALAEVTPPSAVTVPVGRNIWWRGLPPEGLRLELEKFAEKAVGARAG
jgi:hypothetical protein